MQDQTQELTMPVQEEKRLNQAVVAENAVRHSDASVEGPHRPSTGWRNDLLEKARTLRLRFG